VRARRGALVRAAPDPPCGGLLSAGAPMEEISQLLRHAQQRTTAIYARVDQARLAELAVPCPTGAPR
jgi:integrase